MSLSASYTSQDIDRTVHARLQLIYSTVHEDPAIRFHFSQPLYRFPCLPANIAFFGIASACLRLFAAIFGQAYHVGVCATKTMVYTANTTILLYLHPFHDNLHLRQDVQGMDRLLHSFCNRYAVRASRPRPRWLNHVSLEDPNLSKLLGCLPM